jgi:hypothetical protein
MRYIFLFFLFLFYSINFICMFISNIILLNKNLIQINRVIEYNHVNDPCCEIKYLDLYMSLVFFKFIFSYCY